jgi:hypothetical protein
MPSLAASLSSNVFCLSAAARRASLPTSSVRSDDSMICPQCRRVASYCWRSRTYSGQGTVFMSHILMLHLVPLQGAVLTLAENVASLTPIGSGRDAIPILVLSFLSVFTMARLGDRLHSSLSPVLNDCHRTPRSRTQTHGQRHRRTTEIAAIGIMSTHFVPSRELSAVPIHQTLRLAPRGP